MAEQTNFYAVQRGAPWSFRPVSDGVINWYLYNFGSNLGVAFVERPSNLWVEMPWNCIFRVKIIVFSSASGGRSPPDPPLWAPYIFTSGFFFFPCAHPCSLLSSVNVNRNVHICERYMYKHGKNFCTFKRFTHRVIFTDISKTIKQALISIMFLGGPL